MPPLTARRHVLALLASFAVPCVAAEGIPDELVGFWTTEDAEYSGDVIQKGTALYLGKSGRGAMIGGWIGFRVEARFDAAANRLDFDAYDGPNKGPSGLLYFDPSRKVLLDTGKPPTAWYRRATTIPQPIRQQLAID